MILDEKGPVLWQKTDPVQEEENREGGDSMSEGLTFEKVLATYEEMVKREPLPLMIYAPAGARIWLDPLMPATGGVSFRIPVVESPMLPVEPPPISIRRENYRTRRGWRMAHSFAVRARRRKRRELERTCYVVTQIPAPAFGWDLRR